MLTLSIWAQNCFKIEAINFLSVGNVNSHLTAAGGLPSYLTIVELRV